MVWFSQILAHLAHPNIVAYYGSFMQGDDLNVVMEYADGGTLFNRIASAKGPFPEEEIILYFAQVNACLRSEPWKGFDWGINRKGRCKRDTV